MLPIKILHFQSPFQVLFNKIPNYRQLKVFGCLCYPYVQPYTKNKLCYQFAPRTKTRMFLFVKIFVLFPKSHYSKIKILFFIFDTYNKHFK